MIGAVLAGGMGAAQADITVFGQIDQSIVASDYDAGFVNTSKMPGSWFPGNIESRDNDDVNFVSTNSSIGFKGSEDLGNGLTVAFFKVIKNDNFTITLLQCPDGMGTDITCSTDN